MEQIVGRWIFAADGIMPCLAQESGPQSRRNDPGRPSRRSMWRTIGLCRSFAHRDLEALFLCSWDPRNAKCRRHPGFGPTVSPKKFRVVRSRRDTWRTIGLYRHFAHRDFEEQGSAPSHPRNAKCEGVQDSGPQYRRRSSGPSDQGGTRGARLGSIATSPIVTLKSKDQLPPIHETRSAEGIQDSGPQYRRRSSGPSDQGGTRGARLGSIATSPIVTLKSKDQLPPIQETRSAEGASGCGPTVIALGHMEKGQSR
jgi:hypothetical protein